MAPRNEIIKTKLLLVEGADALYFFGSSAKYVQADRFRQFPKCMI
jgi:hypothetical protein